MTTPIGNPAGLSSVTTAPIHPVSCIRVTGVGSHEIVPYQAAVDTYASAYAVLLIANIFNTIDRLKYQTLLKNIDNYFKNAISVLKSNNNPLHSNNTRLQSEAQHILNEIAEITGNTAAPAAVAPAAVAPAAAPTLDKNFLLKASDILFNIAQLLAPPTLPQSKPIKGGRRKRNTRHKHRKNKNKTRVGHR